MKLSDFNYFLDPSLIAQHPLLERDRARLLILHRETGRIEHRSFCDLIEYLRPDDVLIINDTRVFAARLCARKEKTGGGIELLLIRPVQKDTWEALASRRPRVRQRILFDDNSAGEIVGEGDSGRIFVRFQERSDFPQWLDHVGRTPLPPYIKRIHSNGDREKEDRRAYQTVYATFPGSIAAPTAGLHFTQSLLDQVRAIGVQIYALTLHIGPGTFRPVRVTEIEQHTLESEHVRISHQVSGAIQKAKKSGNRVIAVGTTTVRALESAAKAPGQLSALDGWTDLFITPGHRFRVIDALITNFHLPRSTLLMLVSALAGREQLLATYREAIRERYRFYSFGDAMMII
ncbi:MAG TPA: tRNA preQ1(34) S-adenosylmethionine ribosyltransferase-isomerase QueA [Nitrospiria bacterium]|nr:tRNA preQ1(34) S-adenosylmethionine ribosyltransferase-isomerase QueA [Nitrospiria bacterium]